MPVTLQYTVTVAEVKREAQLSNHTFATDEVETHMLEAERLANTYTGRSTTTPWTTTEEDYPSIMLAIRLIAAGNLLGKFANKDTIAQSKLKQGYDILKHVEHIDPETNQPAENEGTVAIVSGSFENDTLETIIHEDINLNDVIGSDLTPSVS